MSIAAIVVAAGRGRRMGGGANKVLLPLGAKPILVHSLEVLHCSSRINRIVVVTRQEDLVAVERLTEEYGITKASERLVLGGAERFDSVLAGLNFLADDPPEAVLIHDAARPFLTQRIIDDTLDALNERVGAIAGVPSKDTIKEVDEAQN
ncbi:MAG: 2-C-methyl-D-erythritol 4-phosphate cytidylyltransferase, partial [bacterium]